MGSSPKFHETRDILTVSATTSSGVAIIANGAAFRLAVPGMGKEPSVDVQPGVDVVRADGAATVLQRRADGVRAMTVISDDSAPSTYEYSLTGAHFAAGAHGTVVVVTADGEPIGFVAPPWALDSEGKAVPTSYEVRDGTLVQHVKHQGAAYPVVAVRTSM